MTGKLFYPRTMAFKTLFATRRVVLLLPWVLACTYAVCMWITFRQNQYLKTVTTVSIKSSATEPNANNNNNNIVFLTFSDTADSGLCFGMETAAMSGIQLGALGVGLTDKFAFLKNVSNAKTRKLFGFSLVLTNDEFRKIYNITNTTLISLSDARDVLYLKPAEYVVERYNEMEKANKRTGLILVGAERNCWPYMVGNQQRIRGGRKICNQFPNRNSTFRYLNSGSIIGRASNLITMLQDVINAMESVNEDDQGCLQKLYFQQIQSNGSIWERDYYIDLDNRQQVIQTSWGTHLEGGPDFTYEEKGAYYNKSMGRIVNTEHNVFPATVHFNGNKDSFLPIAQHYIRFHAGDPATRAVYGGIQRQYHAQYPWYGEKCVPKLEELGLNRSVTVTPN